MAATSEGAVRTTLYACPGAWGLPSASPACLQTEAYLRLSGARFEVVSCASTSKSPTGQLPALECGPEISINTDTSEYTAAKACIVLAQRSGHNLDAHLTAAQKAELLAFSALLESRLDAATSYSIWCETLGYAEYIKAAFKGTPFPLNHLLPWAQRRAMQQRLAHQPAAGLYEDACQVLRAVADKLRTSGGRFIFGDKPCSLDALLAGHLMFYRSAKAAAPVLTKQLDSIPVLARYLDHITSTYFPATTQASSSHGPASSAAGSGSGSSSSRDGPNSRAQGKPSASEEPSTSSSSSKAGPGWSEAGKGHKPAPKPAEPTATELEFRRKSWWWLAGAGTITLAYVLLSGKYIDLDQLASAVGQADDDDDDDDNNGEDQPDGAEDD